MTDPLSPANRKDLKDRISDMVEAARLYHSCMSCQHFEESREVCTLYDVRPPARVIALGCPSWFEIPPF